MSFFETLNYSSCNEDGYTELKALDINKNDTVACITGSGDRVLHMLLGNPKKVYAFDANKIQNYLLELKIIAIKQLSYDEFMKFLGYIAMGKSERITIYNGLKHGLSQDAQHWFDKHSSMIKSGVLYGGRWEKYFSLSSKVMRFWRGKKINTLFSFTDLSEQNEFVQKKWDTTLWRLFLKYSFNPLYFRLIFGDPGFYSYNGEQQKPWQYINSCMNLYFKHNLAKDSFMLALIFYGKFTSNDNLPPYLLKENYKILQDNCKNVHIETTDLFSFLDSENGKKSNKFSLSDVSSFLSKDQYEKLYQTFDRRENCRFCIREFLTQREAPSHFTINFHKELQEQLQKEDTSFGYSFIIGEK